MNVKTFETKSGQKPVDDFIKAQDQSTIAKIGNKIDLLERFGHLLPMPYSKKVTDELYELRIRGRAEVRILYSFVSNEVILLHAFVKKQDKIPRKEIETAQSRLSALDSI